MDGCDALRQEALRYTGKLPTAVNYRITELPNLAKPDPKAATRVD